MRGFSRAFMRRSSLSRRMMAGPNMNDTPKRDKAAKPGPGPSESEQIGLGLGAEAEPDLL